MLNSTMEVTPVADMQPGFPQIFKMESIDKTTHYHYKMKFSIKDFFSKCDQIHSLLPDFITFTKEILNGKLHFLRSDVAKLCILDFCRGPCQFSGQTFYCTLNSLQNGNIAYIVFFQMYLNALCSLILQFHTKMQSF